MTSPHALQSAHVDGVGVPAGTRKSNVPLLLRATAVVLFILPANMVFEPLGAIGYGPMLCGFLLVAFWLISAAFGLHDPIRYRHPGRVALALLLLVSCFSYAALAVGMAGDVTAAGRASADRWLILVIVSVGIALVTTEAVRTLEDAMVLVRALLVGAFVCCVVALVQFIFRINPMEWIETAMIGFVDNGGNTPFQARGTLMRVAGSTFHPIELGVISAMLLPLSIWRALYDRQGWKPFHWIGCLLLVFGVAVPVSRSGIISLLIVVIVTTPFLPGIARKWAFVVVPAILAGMFVVVPGLVGTLFGSFAAGTSDPSITTRLNNFPRVVDMVTALPITGSGPGTYMPTNALHILDNQYYQSAVTMGLPGLLAIGAYFALPGLFALIASRFAVDPQLRLLAGSVAAACLVAAAASATFDSLSFPVFALLYPFFIGLGGAVWLAVRRESGSLPNTSPVLGS
jgi:putative inorganic carbon (HCO3(-)) transporter